MESVADDGGGKSLQKFLCLAFSIPCPPRQTCVLVWTFSNSRAGLFLVLNNYCSRDSLVSPQNQAFLCFKCLGCRSQLWFSSFVLSSSFFIRWPVWIIDDVLSVTKVHISFDMIFADWFSHNVFNHWVLFSGSYALPWPPLARSVCLFQKQMLTSGTPFCPLTSP